MVGLWRLPQQHGRRIPGGFSSHSLGGGRGSFGGRIVACGLGAAAAAPVSGGASAVIGAVGYAADEAYESAYDGVVALAIAVGLEVVFIRNLRQQLARRRGR